MQNNQVVRLTIQLIDGSEVQERNLSKGGGHLDVVSKENI